MQVLSWTETEIVNIRICMSWEEERRKLVELEERLWPALEARAQMEEIIMDGGRRQQSRSLIACLG